ncbi:LysM peptidoglycan-binding domain-containing protein [Paenibacillus arenilitoris]|uniref:LysM peptidoglycan-binding domain-containing protein n=1 Tax=Paenibacillus arenilitoris TaxID=2772299 RepID=A0A927CHZ6_9BACL|nr:LysM peptidoglycan-binding domain-containing protein [Paenibacillus arenilitoris]MBD2867864.1 LysM peptidoglycan-binding domain-containing protein [Paenibacillus arenilitoris]
MDKRTTRSSRLSKGSRASLKQTNLVIYLAVVIILAGICGALYGNITNKADSELPLAGNAEQADGQNGIGEPSDPDSLPNGNDGIEHSADEPIPAGTVDSEEEQASAVDYGDATEEPEPAPSATAGPTETPEPERTEEPTQAPAETVKLPTTYVVRKGDTLSLISEKFYQSKEYYALLAKHNQIVFVNDMQVGDTLNIPALPSTSGSKDGGRQEEKDYSSINLPATYLIQAGDTLSGISRMFFKSAEYADDIAKENKLDKHAGLKAGTNLRIPSLKNDKPDEKNDEAASLPDYETSDHTVKSGETLYSISKIYYGSDKYVKLIADYNHIDNRDDLKAGTVLKIPKA